MDNLMLVQQHNDNSALVLAVIIAAIFLWYNILKGQSTFAGKVMFGVFCSVVLIVILIILV